ncbi:MAG: site-2 protease family protein [Pirellulales bacterium]|nr:site-2 protease family protein [Pirellulales bacterium]
MGSSGGTTLDWCLIAAADSSWLVWTVTVFINILKVAVGLGLVIFVHELGHFVVAKLSGVKCEKFYLGFDIGGLKLAKFTWGETEYGIGILPLGGYVKMLGQEDNPAKLREEIERAKAAESRQKSRGPADGGSLESASAGAAKNPGNPGPSSSPSDEPIDLETAEQALYDPRSYLAKSVPTRMAIISAGVIMNVIFAFLFAIGAYGIGVQQLAPVVGAVTPGDGAWQAGVEVGDRILQIGDERIHTFVDLRVAVSLGDTQDGLKLLIERLGRSKPFWVVAEAKKSGLAPTVGIGSPMTTVLRRELAAYPGSPAAGAKPDFQPGDRIVAIEGEPVHEYAGIYTHLARHPEKPLRVTVQRSVSPDGPGKAAHGKVEQLEIEIAPAPMRQLGLVMEMGPVAGIQAQSPAAEAKLQAGDVVVEFDGKPVGDPMTFPDRLRKLAFEEDRVRLTVRRGNERLEIGVPLRRVDCYDSFVLPDSPVSVPALGLVYTVSNRVAAVLPGSPSEKAGIKRGDVVDRVTIVPPSADQLRQDGFGEILDKISLDPVVADLKPHKYQWPAVMELLQLALPGSGIQVQLASGRSLPVETIEAEDWFNPDRGLLFEAYEIPRRAESLADAVHLGTSETIGALTMVFRTVQRLLDQQVSVKALSGPVGIAQMAYDSAAKGTGELLIFLTVLSANLAVLNFLPIPVLDGGHLVFLAYEGITGRPPNERVQLGLTYAGLLLLLTLMVWVLGLDIGLISRD